MVIQCEDCGSDVVAKRATRRFCDPCRGRKNAVRNRNNYVPVNREYECIRCSTRFTSKQVAKYCPSCRPIVRGEQAKAWHEENKERRYAEFKEAGYSRRHTLKQYGLTVEQFDQMVAEREGCCDICGKVPSKTLCVDHSHETGEVRGLLCSPCNGAIGLLGDNADGLRRALNYLERTE